MSDLSDFKRRVYEPEVSALKQRIATLERERDEALRKAPAYDRARALVELADVAESRAIVRAVAAEARADRYEKAARHACQEIDHIAESMRAEKADQLMANGLTWIEWLEEIAATTRAALAGEDA